MNVIFDQNIKMCSTDLLPVGGACSVKGNLLVQEPDAERNPPLRQLGIRMAYRGQGQKVQKVMVQPINLIFRYLQNRSRIQVWLYEQVNMRIEGCIIVRFILLLLSVFVNFPNVCHSYFKTGIDCKNDRRFKVFLLQKGEQESLRTTDLAS
uniref:Small nuclear ribonucleoprotein polypeptide E n=1 Tax=Oryzias sinensis TaxID=183150 RepID=A0A8C7XMT4_9TELE